MVYRTVDTRFWSDPKVRGLGRQSRYLFLYLMTNGHTHLSGIYYLPFPIIQFETGMDVEQVTAAMDELSTEKLTSFDPENHIIWVVNMLRWQIGWGGRKNPKNMKAVANQLESLHECAIIDCFLKYYEDLNIPYRYPIDTLSTKGTGTGTEIGTEIGTEEEEEKRFPASSNQKELMQEIEETWQGIAMLNGLPQVAKMTTVRKKKLLDRCKSKHFRENFTEAMGTIEKYPFLHGKNDRGWKATFDWFLAKDKNRVDNYINLLEGKYGNGDGK